jgi:hypothetical protein
MSALRRFTDCTINLLNIVVGADNGLSHGKRPAGWFVRSRGGGERTGAGGYAKKSGLVRLRLGNWHEVNWYLGWIQTYPESCVPREAPAA